MNKTLTKSQISQIKKILGYTGNRVIVSKFDSRVSMIKWLELWQNSLGSPWMNSSKEEYYFVNLKTGNIDPISPKQTLYHYQTFLDKDQNIVEEDTLLKDIVLVEHSVIRGTDMGLTIYTQGK
jgi:hypothetical protein